MAKGGRFLLQKHITQNEGSFDDYIDRQYLEVAIGLQKARPKSRTV
jgi:hypothetical protein